jgi:hypothetical protein
MSLGLGTSLRYVPSVMVSVPAASMHVASMDCPREHSWSVSRLIHNPANQKQRPASAISDGFKDLVRPSGRRPPILKLVQCISTL